MNSRGFFNWNDFNCLYGLTIIPFKNKKASQCEAFLFLFSVEYGNKSCIFFIVNDI